MDGKTAGNTDSGSAGYYDFHYYFHNFGGFVSLYYRYYDVGHYCYLPFLA